MLSYSLMDLTTLGSVQPVSSASGTPFTPQSISGLITWMRAEDLSALGEGGKVTTGSNSWFNYVNTTISASRVSGINSPYYTTTKLAGGKPAIHFNGSAPSLLFNILYTLPGTGWTVTVFHKGKPQDAFMLGQEGSNMQFRRYRSDANTISCYNGGQDSISTVLSSSVSQSVVITWASDASNFLRMYEGKRKVFENDFNWNTSLSKINVICGAEFSLFNSCSIAEVCIWSGSVSESDIANLYTNYWLPKYVGEPLFTY